MFTCLLGVKDTSRRVRRSEVWLRKFRKWNTIGKIHLTNNYISAKHIYIINFKIKDSHLMSWSLDWLGSHHLVSSKVISGELTDTWQRAVMTAWQCCHTEIMYYMSRDIIYYRTQFYLKANHRNRRLSNIAKIRGDLPSCSNRFV